MVLCLKRDGQQKDAKHHASVWYDSEACADATEQSCHSAAWWCCSWCVEKDPESSILPQAESTLSDSVDLTLGRLPLSS